MNATDPNQGPPEALSKTISTTASATRATDAAPDKPRGRRPGSPTTREDILAAASRLFRERGFTDASMRAIAREADVDPALIHHYFDSKAHLFAEAAGIGINPEDSILMVAGQGREGFGRRVITFMTSLWDSGLGPNILGALDARNAGMVPSTQALTSQVHRVMDMLGVPAGPVREDVMARAMAVVAGLSTTRYILRIEPAASLEHSRVIRLFGDLLQGIVDDAVAGHLPPARP